MNPKSQSRRATAGIANTVVASILVVIGCAPHETSPRPDWELVYRDAIERQAWLDESEKEFPCFYTLIPSEYVHRGNEPFTNEDLQVLRSVFADLVLTNLLWHHYPLGNPPPLEIGVTLRASGKEIVPPSDFLRSLSTRTLRAVPFQDDLDYRVPRCTLEFRGWLSPDSAYVYAEVTRNGLLGRGAVAVRELGDWKVCPTQWIVQGAIELEQQPELAKSWR